MITVATCTKECFGRDAEGNMQWSQAHVTELGISNENSRKDKTIMPLHHVAPQPWPCCSSPSALTTRTEVKLEVWFYKKDKHPCKAPPPIFKDQVYLPERKEQHMNLSSMEVLPALLPQASSSHNPCDRATFPAAEQCWLVPSTERGQSCTHTATRGGAGENGPAHNHTHGWEELGEKS